MPQVTKLRSGATQLTLGEWPSVTTDRRGDEAPRLKASITISLFDRYQGEKMIRVIPCETDEASDLLPWMEQALKHERTRADVMSFASGRDA